MTKLKKLTLSHNKKDDNWELREDKTKKLVQKFSTKEEATKGGVLQDAAGKNGASVKIKKVDGKIQEERTYPRSSDPKKSKG